jgi:hypothetical protein
LDLGLLVEGHSGEIHFVNSVAFATRSISQKSIARKPRTNPNSEGGDGTPRPVNYRAEPSPQRLSMVDLAAERP